MNHKTFYITTPIYYVNAKPHLGSLYSTLLADVFARWHRLQGFDVFFMTGTDEHGQKIAQAAEQAGKDPQQFVDGFVQAFTSLWHQYSIQYTFFARTTSVQHKEAVIYWINTLLKQGDIYKGLYQGWYCVPCETFVMEKEALQHEQDAPRCPTCSRVTVQLSEEAYFFRLSAYQERLLQLYENNPEFIIPQERAHEVINFVRSGLHDLSISRTTVRWGIPFPHDPGHVVYVWADALNIYLSALGYGQYGREKEFAYWWPAHMQIIGKDILRFHAVYWPAFLMAAGLPLPKTLLVHGWIKMQEEKMSKSRGNVVDPVQLQQQYGTDAVRYYLMRQMAITHDTNFSYEDLEQRITSDLANDLGNLLNRMSSLALQYHIVSIPVPAFWSLTAQLLRQAADTMLQDMQKHMQQGMVHTALAVLWKFIGQVNAYFHESAPWKLAKTDQAQFQEVLSATCHSLMMVGYAAWPVMPHSMEHMLQSLGVSVQYDAQENRIQMLQNTAWNVVFTITKISALFEKPVHEEEKMIEQISPVPSAPPQESISIDQFAQVQLCVGTIVACQAVQQSEKLYTLQVNFGPLGVRTILSGVRAHFTPEQLLHKQGIFVYNLKPRKMMGQESQGMLLTAADEHNRYHLVTVEGSVPNGTQLR